MGDLKHKMTLRLNDDLYQFVTLASEIYGVSPSEYIRQVLNTAHFGLKKGLDSIDKSLDEVVAEYRERENQKAETEGFENGNDRKTDSDNLV